MRLTDLLDNGIPLGQLSGHRERTGLTAVVDLDDPSVLDLGRLSRAVRGSGRIAIALCRAEAPDSAAEVEEVFDLVLTRTAEVPGAVAVEDIDAAVADLVDAIGRHPLAAYTLIRVLRAVPSLAIRDALAVESAAYSMLLAGPEFAQWIERTPRSLPGQPHPTVRLSRVGDRLEIVLARPERRNALSAAMRDELVAALELAVVDESITSVVLSGEGACFCSGGDLAEFGSTPDVVTGHLVRTLRSPGLLLSEVANRAVCRTHGTCVGAGVEIPAFAGKVIAAPATSFRLPEVSMGLIPGAGGTVSITRRIGRSRTAWLALTGRAIDATTALRWGLIDGIDEGAPIVV